MLFNSYIYIFAFLPLVYLLYRRLADANNTTAAIGLLVAASLFYYGWWNPKYLVLIIFSMLANFALGEKIGALHGASRPTTQRAFLMVGITGNLCALGYFKYAGFLAVTINQIAGTGMHVPTIILPLAISFFTFQQIAYLVDVYRHEAKEYRFLHYALFVTFFPQLIAGPIVHHKEMLPQFERLHRRDVDQDLVIGSSIFFVGLFKKAVLADGIAPYANQMFDAAAGGQDLSLFLAWGGTLSYTFQLYFDFSGYSDMAIGSARLFGVRLPLNFHSPYKALSISEFWRRWHMTLSRFLRDYVYITLGGNRRGPVRRYANLALTMLLGGLWHGAGWNFIIWGGLHGIYLTVNHAWQAVFDVSCIRSRGGLKAYRALAWALTFLSVVTGWVFFRAADFETATRVVEGMLGLHGIELPNAIVARLGPLGGELVALGVSTFIGGGQDFMMMALWVTGLMIVAIVMPNTQQVFRHFSPALEVHPPADADAIQPLRSLETRVFSMNKRWCTGLAAATVVGILALNRVSEFLYYQF